jgi:hypothetical protein
MTAMMTMRDSEDFDLIAMASPRAACAVATIISQRIPYGAFREKHPAQALNKRMPTSGCVLTPWRRDGFFSTIA